MSGATPLLPHKVSWREQGQFYVITNLYQGKEKEERGRDIFN